MAASLQDRDISYEEAQPAAEESCRLGDTEHHAAFVLLHLTLLGCFLHAGQRTPMLHCGIICGGVALNIAVHLLFGGVCWSPALTVTVHAHLATFPIVRLSGSQLALNGLLTAASAAHFVKLSSEGAVRAAKLSTLSLLALVNILGNGLGSMDDITADTALTRTDAMLGSVVLILLGNTINHVPCFTFCAQSQE